MKKKATTRITVRTSTRRVVVVGRLAGGGHDWCQVCRARTPMIGLQEAGVIAGMSLGAVVGLLETGALHQGTASVGSPLICLNSLLNTIRRKG